MPRANNNVIPIFRSAFQGPEDEFNTNLGVRPVVFDILAPDQETSLLPEGLKMVLHVNPSSLSFSYEKVIERIQTKGGYVEQHWGDGNRSISFTMVTGGFKRLYTGLSNITGGGFDTGGTRRETIAYDKYLDMLALFHNNGAIYDTRGQIVFHGILKMTFDGGIYLGWFNSFQVSEAAEKPYQFDLSADFTISHEVVRLRSFITPEPQYVQPGSQQASSSTPALEAPDLEGEGKPNAPPVTGNTVKVADNNKPVDPTFQPLTLDSEGGGLLDLIEPDPPVAQIEFDPEGSGILSDYERTTPGWWEQSQLATGEGGELERPADSQEGSG